ncbi:MAG: LacI family DNA-binding transcriptional regulator [Deltaproteobacteria bacterium]|nr:LacI family DNA-binding transcriptional regulator [Deltaproteobacteria bacterium]MBW2018167.1 LacI family DNA-binding transcriptional regulator [Deltaproteobacteria bacterium]MBW2130167.1 LacI family DNA-binding transcriptional regulator [Deltaproteobacteria bacterium]MBW2304880.1 LacI family DNA-binding transcriptional regulator [Deltaproteobacteria bacterium]
MSKPTLRDVAALAGVDPSTVSRVLNGKAGGRVRPETKARILETATQLNYQPNILAKGLRQKQSRTIAAVIPDLVSPHIPEMLKGVKQGAMEHGYTVFISYLDQGSLEQEQHLSLLRESRVDGLILLFDTLDDNVVAELMDTNSPFVLVNQRATASSNFVIVDDVAGARMAVKYLAGLGHTRIAYLSGELMIDCALRRFQGYRRGLEDHGIPFQNALMEESSLISWLEGKRAMERLLARDVGPTAVIAGNIVIATGAMAAVRDAGLRIPEDISIVGIQDAPLAEVLAPPLTVVGMPLYEMGRSAAVSLIDLLTGRSSNISPKVLAPTGMVLRRSAAKPPTQVIEKRSVSN